MLTNFGLSGWGCGYRNALMFLTSVVSSNPQYQCVYAPSGSDIGPGVQMLQQWLEEAWREGMSSRSTCVYGGTLIYGNGAGYDQDGKNQLKGSVVGTNKWIGTSGEIVEHLSVVRYLIWTLALDIYALLSRQGIP